MIELYDHSVSSSFLLWFDYILTKKAQAYQSISSKLYPITDNRFKSKTVFAAPFKQWVADSSVTSIPSGIYVDGTFIPRDVSGLKINYNDGIVMFDNPLSTSVSVSGNYAVKQVNVYSAYEDEETLLINTKYRVNPTFPDSLSGINPPLKTVPCAMLKYTPGTNEGFQLGGTRLSKGVVKATIISDNEYILDGALGIFRDTSQTYFTLLDSSQMPYNSYGDLKSGVYNYETLITQDPARMVYISSVESYKSSEKISVDVNKKVYVGFLDFEINKPREVHVNS